MGITAGYSSQCINTSVYIRTLVYVSLLSQLRGKPRSRVRRHDIGSAITLLLYRNYELCTYTFNMLPSYLQYAIASTQLVHVYTMHIKYICVCMASYIVSYVLVSFAIYNYSYYKVIALHEDPKEDNKYNYNILLNNYCKCMSARSLMCCSQFYIGSYRLAVWLDHLQFSELHSYSSTGL